MELRTDASIHDIAAILAQRQNGQMRMTAYTSRLFYASERNYFNTEQECLALVWAITEFCPYIFGFGFCVITDHHALRWLFFYIPAGRLRHWA